MHLFCCSIFAAIFLQYFCSCFVAVFLQLFCCSIFAAVLLQYFCSYFAAVFLQLFCCSIFAAILLQYFCSYYVWNSAVIVWPQHKSVMVTNTVRNGHIVLIYCPSLFIELHKATPEVLWGGGLGFVRRFILCGCYEVQNSGLGPDQSTKRSRSHLKNFWRS